MDCDDNNQSNLVVLRRGASAYRIGSEKRNLNLHLRWHTDGQKASTGVSHLFFRRFNEKPHFLIGRAFLSSLARGLRDPLGPPKRMSNCGTPRGPRVLYSQIQRVSVERSALVCLRAECRELRHPPGIITRLPKSLRSEVKSYAA
jgi:hypothetical protein